MLRVVGRIFNGKSLVGYQLTDGQQSKPVTKLEAWQYAKNNQIMNVRAIGTIENPGLSGINGFELKELPQINQNAKPEIKCTVYDMNAALIRNSVQNGKYMLDIRKDGKHQTLDIIKSDINKGIVNLQNKNSLSNSIKVQYTVKDSKASKKAIALVDSELGKDANFKSLQECIILIDRIANEAVKELKRTNANEVNFSNLPFTHDKEFTKALLNNNAIRELIKGADNDTLGDAVKSAFKTNEATIKSRGEIAELKQKISEMKIFLQYHGKKFDEASPTVGYKIQNTGINPITYTRIKSTIDHSMSKAILKPNETVIISRAEMTLLAANPHINCQFANGNLLRTAKRSANNVWDFLNAYYFRYAGNNGSIDNAEHDLWKEVDEETIRNYFIA